MIKLATGCANTNIKMKYYNGPLIDSLITDFLNFPYYFIINKTTTDYIQYLAVNCSANTLL